MARSWLRSGWWVRIFAEAREVVSRVTEGRVMPRHRRVHIMRGGHEIDTEEDEEGLVGKRALGDASHGSLAHFGSMLRADEVDVKFCTSPDLRVCHLVENEEKRWFRGCVYHRIYMTEAELMLSNEIVDHLTKDLEVSTIRSIMLAHTTRRRHGYSETDLREHIVELEKSKKEVLKNWPLRTSS